MNIALVNEATYPVHGGGVSEWCQLMVSKSTARFTVTTVVGDVTEPMYQTPPSVVKAQQLPMWPLEQRRAHTSRQQRAALREQLHQLCAALLPHGWESDPVAAHADVTTLRAILQSLTTPSSVPLAARLRHEDVVAALLAAPGWGERPVLDAVDPARTLCQLLGILDRGLVTTLDDAHLIHATCNGVAGMVAMVHADARQLPLLLTEHGIYLRERYIDASTAPQQQPGAAVGAHVWSVLARCVYQAATLVTSVAQANYPWLQAFGVERERFRTVHNGVSPRTYSVLPEPTGPPTVVWVGRFGPMKDLLCLVESMTYVITKIPQAKLLLCGPADASGEYHAQVRALVAERGLLHTVEFVGEVASSVDAYARGHVVALSSITEGLPFTVMEALMCGRATVSTDVGGVHEIVGTDNILGSLVPPKAPQLMGESLVTLLSDPQRRAAMGAAARQWAKERFSDDACIEGYHRLYRQLTENAPRSAGRVTASENQRGGIPLSTTPISPALVGSVS